MGFPSEKIILGVPFYGRGWAKIIPTDPNLPLFGTSVSGAGISLSGKAGEPGLSSWKDIKPLINKNGYKQYYDPISHAVFLHKTITGETWSYDNVDTMKEKVQYVKDKNLGGIGCWEISDDTRDGSDSLLVAMTTNL